MVHRNTEALRPDSGIRRAVGRKDATAVAITALIVTVGVLACGGTPKASDSGTGMAGATATNGAVNAPAVVPGTSAPAGSSMTGSPSGASSGSATGAAHVALSAAGADGEDLYDAIKANSWGKARTLLDSLTNATRSLATGGTATAEQQQLTAVVDTLRRTIPARQHDVSLQAANRVTYLAARMEAAYHPTTPVEVLLLDYYGRELEIWSGVRNNARLTQTRDSLQATWNKLRPAVQSRGRGDQASRTDSLVKKIAAATTPAEYGRLAKPFLDEVDELEKVFTKQ